MQATGGRAVGNKNEPLDLGSPKLAQGFTSLLLPEMMSLATSGRSSPPFCESCKFELGSKSVRMGCPIISKFGMDVSPAPHSHQKWRHQLVDWSVYGMRLYAVASHRRRDWMSDLNSSKTGWARTRIPKLGNNLEMGTLHFLTWNDTTSYFWSAAIHHFVN